MLKYWRFVIDSRISLVVNCEWRASYDRCTAIVHSMWHIHAANFQTGDWRIIIISVKFTDPRNYCTSSRQLSIAKPKVTKSQQYFFLTCGNTKRIGIPFKHRILSFLMLVRRSNGTIHNYTHMHIKISRAIWLTISSMPSPTQAEIQFCQQLGIVDCDASGANGVDSIPNTINFLHIDADAEL